MPIKHSLQEASNQSGIPVRKLAFLFGTGLLKADLEGGKLVTALMGGSGIALFVFAALGK